ncbi:MAG: GH1 family beta-glucosidase [Thermaerobacter sp.]|nr:GH1 family beta-glucosidase [Thermaerobacter sp.]
MAMEDELVGVFPPDFKWGVATAAYQIEGATREDGRGASIWDDFSHTPGRVFNGDTGDTACDHYHRYAQDVALMARLNIRHYRFSVAWPRVLADGKGPVNPAGMDYYERLVDTLLANGVEPAVTLYHWDLPSRLQSLGGWTQRDTVAWFRDYSAMMAARLGDRVKMWITHNEPWCTAVLGHYLGKHAPGKKDPVAARVAAHHVLLSHGLAVDAMRAERADLSLGITLNLNHPYPADPDSGQDVRAARYADVFQNRWFLDPVLKGVYPADLDDLLGPAPHAVRPEDLDRMAAPIDFLGVNYYSTDVVQYDPGKELTRARPVTPTTRVTDMGWPVVPQGLTDLLLRLGREYPGLPLYITENGAAYRDRVINGHVDDAERIRYLKDHMRAMADAVSQGVDVRGYYLWSLLDNFEWEMGYSKRFGIVYVDYATQQRIPKQSAEWYAEWIRGRRWAVPAERG